jgi:hypothetical protein
MHDFNQDLAYSRSQSDAPYWKQVYQKAFPDMTSMVDVRKDGWAQRGGIDRIIITTCGRIWKIDEKVRRRAYDDILLEFISNDITGSLGWIEKDLACDFIAYALVPTQQCYLFPVRPLQRAWQIQGKSGKKLTALKSRKITVIQHIAVRCQLKI